MTVYARLTDMTSGTDEAHDAFMKSVMERIADGLADLDDQVAVQVRLVGAQESRAWSIRLDNEGARAELADVEKPDLEILTRVDTFRQIANGSYSPLEAFLDGQLRVRGDAELGKRIVRHLSGPEGAVNVC